MWIDRDLEGMLILKAPAERFRGCSWFVVSVSFLQVSVTQVANDLSDGIGDGEFDWDV